VSAERQNPLFRQAALDRLSSPEQLDALIQVTRPRGWLALIGLGLLLVAATTWGFLGAIPTRVNAPGVLIRPGGIFDVHAPVAGQLVELLVAEGALVSRGQPVAHLSLPAAADGAVTVVTSPNAGRVVELKRNAGAIVAPGTALMSLELSGDASPALQVVAYVPATQGKNVQPGMSVQVSPTTAARQEYGFLVGRVRAVSDFPSTPDGMTRTLGNPALAQSLSAGGPPFATYVELERDPTSASGYLWSSAKGSPVPVNSGTMCVVTITIRTRRPIDLVIPLLRQVLGL
jgi:multidrug efflux pump subunit AcrA (membrane-fusion protein)